MIKLICDSATGLSKEFVAKHDIEIARLHVIAGNENFLDGDISIDDVFKKQDEGTTVSTSQPTPQDFVHAIERQVAKGATQIVIFTISKGLSGTMQSATIAKGLIENPNVDVRVVNTGSASVGAEAVVCDAVRILTDEPNISLDEFERRSNILRENNTTILTIDNLNTLINTGRVSKLAGAIGNLFKIKPCIELINDKTEITKKFRGKDKMVEYMVERVVEKAAIAKKTVNVIISHVRDLSTAQMIHDLLSNIKNVKPYITDEIGPVLAVHLGRGGFGIGFTHE